MKVLRVVLSALLLSLCFHSHAQREIRLYDEKDAVPGHEQWRTSKNGRTGVSRVTTPTLTCFFPRKRQTKRSAVIICPGGGYSSLSIVDGGYDVAKQFADSGIVAFVLKYRTVGESFDSSFERAPLKDVQKAISMVREKAQEWNIHPQKIGVLGFSAGGHLAAMAAVKYDDAQVQTKVSLRPDFTIFVYPVISFADSLTSQRSSTRKNLLGSNPSRSKKRWFSPETQINNNIPPAFLIHAANDSTAMVQNSIVYFNELLHHHVPAKLLIYQKGGHGFALHNREEDDYWLPSVIRWMHLNKF